MTEMRMKDKSHLIEMSVSSLISLSSVSGLTVLPLSGSLPPTTWDHKDVASSLLTLSKHKHPPNSRWFLSAQHKRMAGCHHLHKLLDTVRGVAGLVWPWDPPASTAGREVLTEFASPAEISNLITVYWPTAWTS